MLRGARRWPGGGGRSPGTTRARSCWTWPSRWPSAGTAWPTSPSCGRIRRCSGRWPRTRRCPAASTPWPPTPRQRSRPSPPPGLRLGSRRGSWPVSTPPTTARMPPSPWSSTWTPPWSPRIRRRSPPRRHSSAGSASIRCGPSSTTDRMAPGNLSVLLRRGNAGSNTVTDHKTVIRAALAQPPGYQQGRRPGKNVLIRIDGAGGTHELLDWLTRRRLSYSVGFSLPGDAASIQAKLAEVPAQAWTSAYDADGHVRPGAWVAELTGLFDLSGWPPDMRLIVRKERPHPGAQLRITDVDGNRITAFVTNTHRGQVADLELRHRRRARAEDRIRCAKDTGLANLPLHDFAQNQIWCALVALAADLLAWMQTLALTEHPARRWEPKRLRLRMLSIAGRLAVTGRRRLLHLAATAPFTDLALDALDRLDALAAPG